MLLDFWWSLALGLKTSGQSKAFWYYTAEKRQTSVEEILSFLDGGCAPQCSLFERVFFFYRSASKEISLLYFMFSLG